MGRHCDQMYVVGHEAIGQYFNFIFLAIFPQPGQIGFTVFIHKENVFTPEPPHNSSVFLIPEVR